MNKLLLFPIIILLSGCSHDLDLKQFEDKSAEDILKSGKIEMDKKNYTDAAQIFEELEKLYPYAKVVSDAQIYSGDCYYNVKKYDEASSAFEIFVKTHPTHEKVPYALYMLGIINYEQMPIIERDQDLTAKALAYFIEVVRRYPESKYVKDSEEKIKILRQQMAARELYVARYYQSKNNYAAAIGRLNTIVEVYFNTNQAPEAIHRLVECYVAMGLYDEAKLMYKVLTNNFPKTKWADYSYKLINSLKKS